MKQNIYLIIILILLLSSSPRIHASTTITLQDADTEVLEDWSFDSSSSEHYGSMIKFNISFLPIGATIEDATLGLYRNYNDYATDYVQFYRSSNQSWVEGVGSCTTAWNVYSIKTNATGRITFEGDLGWKSANVTIIVRESYNAGEKNSTIVFDGYYAKPTDCSSVFVANYDLVAFGNGLQEFTSKEGAAGQRPYLNITYSEDSIPPTPTLGTNPIDYFNFSSSSVTFDFKAYDNVDIDTIQLFGNWSGSWSSNYTNSSYTNDTWLNVSVAGIPDGIYPWGIFANDSVGNSAWSSNRTFRVDTTPPVSTASATYFNTSTYTFNSWSPQNITVTISAIDTGIGFDNTAYPKYCTDTSNTCTPSTFIGAGKTITTEGTSYIRYFSNDTLGNNETISSQTIKIDTTPPSLNITYPTNNLNLSYSTFIPLNFSTADSSSGLDMCWYNIDLGSNTTISCSANTTFNTTEGNHILYLYSNDSVTNLNNTETIAFTVDLTNPDITLNSPENNTNSSTASINFNATISDNLALANVTLYIDDSLNETNSSGINNTFYNFSKILSEGVHNWTIESCDYSNNCVNSSTYNLTIDLTYPSISYNADSDANQTFRNSDWIFINITASDTYKDSVQFEFDGVNETFDNSDGNYYWENKTGVSEGNHSFFAWINDSAGNYNVTENRTVIIDLTDPVISILEPTASTYNDNVSMELNLSISDTNLNTCWYNLDDTANVTIDCAANTTFNTTEATHTLYLFANDSSGRKSMDSVTFIVSLSPPSISLDAPADNKWLSYSNIPFNYTASDSLLDTCELYGNFTGTWGLNDTNSTPNNGSQSTFYEFIPEGSFIWNIQCNNTGANSAWGGVTNRTLNVDTTFPLISFTANVKSNDTNTTNNFIFSEVSVTEANEKNITFTLFNSAGNYNTTTFTDGTRSLNMTSLPDDYYYYNVSIYDKAGNYNYTETRKITLDDTKPTITVDSPLSQNYGDNNSVMLNYTASDNLIGMGTCWYYVYFSNGTLAKTTKALTSCQNDTFSLPGGDNNFVLTLLAQDLLNNVQSKSVTFGIRTESPVIVLYPTNNSASPTELNHYFNFTSTTNADNISTCELYINSTGTYHKNQTITNPAYDGSANSFEPLNLSEGPYIWNVWCNDSLNNAGWSLSNNTYIIDLTYPALDIISLTTTTGSQTFNFNTSVNDSYLDSCKYTIYNSLGSIDGLNENVSFTCNSLTSATATAYGTFTLKTYASDTATNENSTNESLTLTASSGETSGGGGGQQTKIKAIAIVQPKNDTNYYSNLQRAILYARIYGICKDMKKCILNSVQKDDLLENLSSQYAFVESGNIQKWIDSYNSQDFESVDVLLRDADTYGLITASLTIISPGFQIISPSNFDRLVFLFSDDVSQNVILSKEVKSCDIIQGDLGFSCEARGGYAVVSYEIPQELGSFTFKNVIATISYQSIDGDNSSQIVSFRLIRPTLYLMVWILGIAATSIIFYFNRGKIIKSLVKIKKIKFKKKK